jgi:hypothetical protein
VQYDLRPMLATLADKPFDDPAWIFETKWDGFAPSPPRPGHAVLCSRGLFFLRSPQMDIEGRVKFERPPNWRMME